MQVTGIACPSCGAPILLHAGNSSGDCEYCGKRVIVESKMLEDAAEKFTSTLHASESKTRVEIQRVQLTQELSMLQMQLSNLRTERRNLERNKNRQTTAQLAQIQAEEKGIIKRISTLQNTLNSTISTPNNPGYPLYDPQASTCSQSTALLLAIFLGIYGVHRFYTGHIRAGFIQMLTGGGFVIWWFIDILTIATGNFKDSKGRSLNKTPMNPMLKQFLIFFFLGTFIMAMLLSITGATKASSANPAMMPISFVLSALILYSKKILAFVKSVRAK